jgi:ribose-phosphate pyrophosphokinase
LNAKLVVIDKRRPAPNKVEVMNVIGDVEGQNILLIDDLIDTAGTFVSAIKALKLKGANKIFGAITHAVLSGSAIEKIESSELDKLYVTDSIPLAKSSSKIEVKSATHLFAEAIIRSHNNESISSLFDVDKS